MDDDNSKSISMSEFTKATKEHTLEWTPNQVKILFDHFDADKSGSISFDEFIFGVRGELNERREQLVLMAFEVSCVAYEHTTQIYCLSSADSRYG
jgi:calcyphosin